jgi:uncharacterized coiled-coil DUF342 family protein
MSVEIHDRLISLLKEVDELKAREAGLKSERVRHQELILVSENEVTRLNSELEDLRENSLRLRREMDDLKNDLFRRDEDEVILEDNTHTPTEEGASTESEGHRLWKDRQRQLKSVT